MLYALCQISGQQTATKSIQVKPVRPEKMSPLPEDIKVVYEVHVVGATGSGEPGVQAEQPAEVTYSSATGGGGARD